MTDTSPSPYLYKPGEAAAAIGVCRATVYRRTSPRDLNGRPQKPWPHHKMAGVGLRFTRGDIDTIVASLARGGTR